MSNDKPKQPSAKSQQPSTGTPAAAVAKPPPPAKIIPAAPAPLFRRIDWFTLLITFAAVWLGYYLTLAPELTLEDSGELATGSFYAGIPHPPGYPVWTIYTWLWTVLLPIKNVAWRVALGEATGGALAAGLLGLLVSRGSSLLMEGIEELKQMTGRWENAICMVSGFVAGMLIGFNGFMWSQSVIVEVYAFSVASLVVVLLCLLRWIYAPHQRRYLYYALFFHGVCFTNHQTLIVAAMGIEIAIAAANFRMGRNLFLWNSIVYFAGLILKSEHMLTTLEQNPAVFVIFNVVGVCSILAYFWFSFRTKETFPEFCLDACQTATIVLIAAGIAQGGYFWLLVLVAIAGWIKFAIDTWKLGWEWLVVLICGGCWLLGASFYFYMPLAGMTNPPMEWGYPRTVEGFIHAFTRGQYEKANPSDIIHHPLIFLTQLGMLGKGIIEEFNWIYALLALVPFAFFFKLHRRERAWLIGITAIYFFLGVLLLILLNPPADRAAQGLVRVFFTASHTLIALLVGYGLTLIAAYMATHYQRFRRWGYWAGALAVALALYSFAEAAETFIPQPESILGITHLFAALSTGLGFGILVALTASYYLEGSYYTEPRIANLIGLAATGVAFFVVEIGFVVSKTHLGDFSGATLLFAVIGQSFAKDQYGLPIFAGLILIGSIVLFLVSLGTYKSRAPLAITLGLFALMPLYSIMTHWSDNEQRNHWFGYWFGHDMFTPPFNGPDGKPLYPQMTKDTVLFGGTDPGRFCPTYMIFCDSFLPTNCQPAMDPTFDRRDVYLITQNALADGTYLNYIRAQYNRSAQIDPPFFQELFRSDKERAENYTTNIIARAVQPLDNLFIGLGDRIEKRRRTYTSWFTDKDFKDLPSFTAKLRSQEDPLSKYLNENLSAATRQLLSGSGNDAVLRQGLIKDLNVLLERELNVKKAIVEMNQQKAEIEQDMAANPSSERLRQKQDFLTKEISELSKTEPLYESNRFSQVKLSDYITDFIKQNPQSHTRIRLNRLLLEEAYPREIAKSLGGVYPDREIYQPSPEDSQRCFSEYLQDAQRRLDHDSRFPNEPRQIKPGEDVKVVDNRVQVSGQVAVMAINGLLTKVIFDHNPKNEFYVEESFPLDWMYPHLTPFGIIMKINRQPLSELNEDICRRDHDFWKQFSKRLTGDIVDYDTPVKTITEWIEKTYLRRDFSGFAGDRAFVRDDSAQKAFSKLRSSIAGVYTWRVMNSPPGSPQHQRMIKEADFAFKQAFAFCPYSPEAVFRYVNLLLSPELQRFDDALAIAETCLKLDPYNGAVINTVNQLRGWKKDRANAGQANASLQQLQKEVQANPADFQKAFNLASAYLQMQRSEEAMQVLDTVLNNPRADAGAIRGVLDAYATMSRPRLQPAVDNLQTRVQANPTNFQLAVGLADGYILLQQNDKAVQTLDQIVDNPGVDSTTVLQVAEAYNRMKNFDKLEATLGKLVKIAPELPEAWYDLAALKSSLNKPNEAMPALRRALELSAVRHKKDAKTRDLVAEVQKDPQFANLRQSPEFKDLLPK